MALESGATAVVAERGQEGIAKVRDILGGGADVALECVGTEAAVDQALGSPFTMVVGWALLGFLIITTVLLDRPSPKIFQWQAEQHPSRLTISKFCSRLSLMGTLIRDVSSLQVINLKILIKPIKTWMNARPLRL